MLFYDLVCSRKGCFGEKCQDCCFLCAEMRSLPSVTSTVSNEATHGGKLRKVRARARLLQSFSRFSGKEEAFDSSVGYETGFCP